MKVLDLFSGIGGFSLGLERAGMKTVAFCEQDKHCQAVLRKHWPECLMFNDVKDLTGKDGWITNKKGTTKIHESIDVICGGFPCQDISVAGHKKGLEGERSGLWAEFKRLIKEVKPRYAIIENVANLRSNGLTQILQDLWKIGYASEWHIISARSVGAPHLRERIWIVAYPQCKGLEGYQRSESQGNLRETEGKQSQHRRAITYNSGPLYVSTNSHNFRLWKPFATEEEKQKWWTEATSRFRDWWEVESPFCRVDDGLSRELDKGRAQRIKQLGNAVVPQIVELIGNQIMEYEKEVNHG